MILGAAALVLAVSPEAREGARKAIVKSTAATLDFVDQVKHSSFLTAAAQKQPELSENPVEQAAEDTNTPLN